MPISHRQNLSTSPRCGRVLSEQHQSSLNRCNVLLAFEELLSRQYERAECRVLQQLCHLPKPGNNNTEGVMLKKKWRLGRSTVIVSSGPSDTSLPWQSASRITCCAKALVHHPAAISHQSSVITLPPPWRHQSTLPSLPSLLGLAHATAASTSHGPHGASTSSYSSHCVTS
jgi:hypothetical protein